MSKSLKIHHKCLAQHFVTVSSFIANKMICFEFVVDNYHPHTSEKFSKDYQENWGLWEFDVVEVFIKKEDSDAYLEVQTSALGQPFALIIEKPRQKYHTPQSLNLKIENKIKREKSEKIWRAKIQLHTDDIPGQSSKLLGNCFACLGTPEKREYYALNINTDDEPNFHRPDLFVELGEIQ